jgi:hypothetical protein
MANLRGALVLTSLGLGAQIFGCSSDDPTGQKGTAGSSTGATAPSAGSSSTGSTNTSAGQGPTMGGNTSATAGATSGGAQVGSGGMSGSSPTAGSGPQAGTGPAGPAIGAAEFAAGELDAVSDGGTLTFQNLGKAGAYPSRRDPASGMCDRYSNGACCMTAKQVTSDKLTPWDEELIVTLRGPMQIKQFVVYTPGAAADGPWNVASAWDSRKPGEAFGIAFDGNATKDAPFVGTVGSECLADVMTDQVFPCGPNSVPYCPAGGGPKNYGWGGSKLFVLTARMPMVGGPKFDAATTCPAPPPNNWHNAPWLGISLGELVREGKFSDCNCYGKTPVDWYAGDGCGQINAFEVVNDNNDFQNFDVFSSNVFAYYGNVGEGPCGKACNLSGTGPADLIDKSNSQPASKGGVTTFGGAAAHVAFRRPSEGYRYILALFDVNSRQMQLAVIHPSKVPASAAGLLPSLPETIDRATVDALLGLRLPQ